MMNDSRPKHRLIFETLQRQIAEGKYADGHRLPSETEIADRHGVSRPTAARALRDLQQLGILDRRAGSGTFLRQTPLAPAKTTYGLLVPGLGDTEILDPICNDITHFAQANRANVLWGDGTGKQVLVDDVLRICRYYIDEKVAGVFFAPFETIKNREEINLQIVADLRAAGIAVVLLDRDATEYPTRSDCDLVGIDNFGAGLMLTQHLISLGHRRFTFFARPSAPSTTDLRIAGCREGLARADITPAKNWIQFSNPHKVKIAKELLDRNKPEVIICSNDRTAAELIQTLTQMKIRVPDDVGVVGFDDVRYATLLAAPLTTMQQPCREIAQAAVMAMIQRIAIPNLHPRQILLTAHLVIRQSCRRGTAVV